MAARGDLFAAAEAVRDAAANGLGGATLDRPPYVTHGDPVFDCCQQLVVQIASVTPNRAAASSGGFAQRRDTAVYLVAAFRVTVSAKFPSDVVDAATMQVFASDAADRAWGAYNAVLGEITSGSLFPPGCRSATIQPLVPVAISGGCGGYVFDVQAQIDGLEA